ncbi:hypothetical protein LPJ66_003095 [Kickxella alabastrina]|uniref:Uncharacterized protein n=1 Tax=Kickxella alabastrina TaxID=61397 RepID=A0ACC1IKU3_9FUNG|nr:hypothetical protein LPJ66_003095 [Kickxella alabastrina]
MESAGQKDLVSLAEHAATMPESHEMEVDPQGTTTTKTSDSAPAPAPSTPTTQQTTEPRSTSTPPKTADKPITTPMKKSGPSVAELLSEAIPGATPGRQAGPKFRCVYPPCDKTQSLIVEHFGFLPISFIDEIINAANDTVYRATDGLSKFVEKEQGTSEATSQAVNKAETLLEHAVDKNFDKFELYTLRNLFNIPSGLEDYVEMPHRRVELLGEEAVGAGAEGEAELDARLERVRRQLETQNLLKTRLRHDLVKAERSVRRLRAVNERLRIVDISKSAVEKDEALFVTAAEVRGNEAEMVRMTEQVRELNFIVDGSEDPALAELAEVPGRDVYLARMADIQVAKWEAPQVKSQSQSQSPVV